MNSAHLIPFSISLVLTSVLAPLILQLLVRAKSRQTISQYIQEHAHKQGTPTMGGIIVLVGALIAMALAWQPDSLRLVLLLVAFGAIGFIDDYLIPKLVKGKRGFDWMPKLAIQVAGAVGCIWIGGITDPVTVAIGVFVILFYCNAYNFSDGLDTLSGGLGLIKAAGILAMLSLPIVRIGLPSSEVHSFETLAVGLIAGFLPFLVLNAAPAKVFMGDVGSLPIGAAFGYIVFKIGLSLTSTGSITAATPLLLFAIVMFIEIVPVPIQVGWVKLFKKKFFPFKTPVHHAFQQIGWPEPRIAWLFHAVQLASTVLAVLALSGVSKTR